MRTRSLRRMGLIPGRFMALIASMPQLYANGVGIGKGVGQPPVIIRCVDELAHDATKLRRLEHQAAELRESMRARIRRELLSGTPQVEIVRRTGWSRETIRK